MRVSMTAHWKRKIGRVVIAALILGIVVFVFVLLFA